MSESYQISRLDMNEKPYNCIHFVGYRYETISAWKFMVHGSISNIKHRFRFIFSIKLLILIKLSKLHRWINLPMYAKVRQNISNANITNTALLLSSIRISQVALLKICLVCVCLVYSWNDTYLFSYGGLTISIKQGFWNTENVRIQLKFDMFLVLNWKFGILLE